MRVLPVLDLMGGHVVRGIAGRRAEYRPLARASDPLTVARGFRRDFGLATLYVADLDAIAAKPPSIAVYEQLMADGFTLWLDAGLRGAADAKPLLGAHRLIAGLETLASPGHLAELVDEVGAERLVFSLDLKDGKPLASTDWPVDPMAIARTAISFGIRSIIVLDLARVGVGQGIGTGDLCVSLRREFPPLEIITGGGIRQASDLLNLETLGVDWALVASALHDGEIGRDDVVALSP